MCVDAPEEKEKIRQFIIKFKNQLRRGLFYKMFSGIINYVEIFGGSSDPTGHALGTVMPALMNDENLGARSTEIVGSPVGAFKQGL
jgi:hypothetical protein